MKRATDDENSLLAVESGTIQTPTVLVGRDSIAPELSFLNILSFFSFFIFL